MADKRFCSKCGEALEEGANFCSYCGKSLGSVPPVPEQAPPAPPAPPAAPPPVAATAEPAKPKRKRKLPLPVLTGLILIAVFMFVPGLRRIAVLCFAVNLVWGFVFGLMRSRVFRMVTVSLLVVALIGGIGVGGWALYRKYANRAGVIDAPPVVEDVELLAAGEEAELLAGCLPADQPEPLSSCSSLAGGFEAVCPEGWSPASLPGGVQLSSPQGSMNILYVPGIAPETVMQGLAGEAPGSQEAVSVEVAGSDAAASEWKSAAGYSVAAAVSHRKGALVVSASGSGENAASLRSAFDRVAESVILKEDAE